MRTLQIQGQEFKKQLIVQEATSILSHKPYEAVTMDEIAKALGCGKSTLYKYFESKDLLFAYVIYAQLETFAQQIETSCMQEAHTPTALHNCLEISYHFFRQNSRIFSSWLRYESNTDVRTELFEKIRQLTEQKYNHMVTLFQRGIDEGFVSSDFPALELAHMMEQFFLSCVFNPLGQEPLDDETGLAMLNRLLCIGILSEEGRRQMSFA